MVNSGMRRVLEALASGVVVYVLVVACSSGGDEAGGGSGGTLADALTDPVSNADAEESGTRLKVRRYVSTDGAKQFAGFRDTQRDEACTAKLAEDGKMRCLPDAMTRKAPLFYADANCTQPVLADAADCLTEYLAETETDCHGTRTAIFKIGTQVQIAQTYSIPLSTTDCQPAGAQTGFELTRIQASDFAEFADVTDP